MLNIPARIILLVLSFAMTLLLSACGGSPGSTGTLSVSLTDAPACGFDHVYVTVSKVRVHQSTNVNVTDSDAGWHDIALTTPTRIDLLDLTNGVLFTLGETTLPAGHYQQLRLVLTANTGNSAPYANSVVPSGGSETALTTPSGIESGIKLINQFRVEADQRVDLVLDFDACKSVVHNGNSGKYSLKPVIKVVPVVVSGRIEGWVDPALAASTPVEVSAQVMSGTSVTNVKATVADAATGKFILAPVLASSLQPGSYNLVFTTANHATAVVTGVNVTAATTVAINTAGSPVSLDTSTPRAATGIVSVSGSSNNVDASLQALQTPSAGLSVEIAYRGVDPTDGGYAFALPIAAAKSAAYVDAASPLVFTNASSSAGLYTLSAALADGRKLTFDIDLTAADVTQDFAF